MKKHSLLLRTAQRRWGSVRVVPGGRSRPACKKRIRPRLPGTAAERSLVRHLVGRVLPPDQLADAIRLLRAGAKLKEIEINERLETLLD